MEMPYTPAPVDAFLAAQSSIGVVLGAVIWHRPIRPIVSSVLLVVASWIIILLPIASDVVAAVSKLPPGAELAMLHASAAFATIAMLLSRPRWLAWVALLGESVLAWLC